MRLINICFYCLKNQKRFLPNPVITKPLRRSFSTHKPLPTDILRRSRIKKSTNTQLDTNNFKTCTAYCTGESYNLEEIRKYFTTVHDKYSVGILPNDASDVLHISKSQYDDEQKGDIFLFRRLGAFVCWNITEEEIACVRDVLKQHERGSYAPSIIDEEYEQLNYIQADRKTSLLNGDIFLSSGEKTDDEHVLEKLAFSNAMALSVKLDMWELALEKFSVSLRYIPEILKRGYKVAMTRREVLQKIGELLTLRHQINLYSDVLAVPDFYWDREDLEMLYLKTCTYLEISKRTKVMNEKLNLCTELVEMLRSHLNDEHSHRLEWMIIVLIAIEILFEVIRLGEKYL